MARLFSRGLLTALSLSLALAPRLLSIASASAGSAALQPQQVQQRAALLAFKASGGAANVAPLESWTANGTAPCGAGGASWAGVSCSGGPNVTALDLGTTRGHYEFEHVAGDIGALAPLVQLTRLVLNGCFGIGGQVGDLAPLVRLTTLDLSSIAAVAGDIESL
jgi:hypothetical protein